MDFQEMDIFFGWFVSEKTYCKWVCLNLCNVLSTLSPPHVHYITCNLQLTNLKIKHFAIQMDLQTFFFSWKLRSIWKFWIQHLFCAILGGQDIYKTKCGSETDNFIFMLSHNGLKTSKFAQSSANWPKWCLVGLVTQTDSIDVKTVFILIVFKIYRTS